MPEKPNIIYILADDMGYGDLSCLNENSKIRTANLDSLAGDGMTFTDAHSASAVCTPSRYSILTGRYNWRSALKKGVLFGYSPPLIEPDRMTVASFLKKHGYSTACIGKWHLGWSWKKKDSGEEIDFKGRILNGPLSCGFDYFFGISASLDMPPYVYVENDHATAVPDRIVPESAGKGYFREGPAAPDFTHGEVLSRLAEKSLEYISGSAGEKEPFFLYLPLTAPHTPILPDRDFIGKSGTNVYGDFCLQIDDITGRITKLLKEKNIEENTIVIFTSDNGCSPTADFEELSLLGHNPSYVFRGHKADIYEGGHRIPLIVRWPDAISPGTVCDDTVCLADLLATCAEITGDKLPDEAGEDSVSSLSIWRGLKLCAPIREATVHHSIDGSFAVRKGRWKLEMCPGSGGWSFPRPGEAFEGLPEIQLYDMEEDIGERVNVYGFHPDVVDELKKILRTYIRTGRSTPGRPQPNTGSPFTEEPAWMKE